MLHRRSILNSTDCGDTKSKIEQLLSRHIGPSSLDGTIHGHAEVPRRSEIFWPVQNHRSWAKRYRWEVCAIKCSTVSDRDVRFPGNVRTITQRVAGQVNESFACYSADRHATKIALDFLSCSTPSQTNLVPGTRMNTNLVPGTRYEPPLFSRDGSLGLTQPGTIGTSRWNVVPKRRLATATPMMPPAIAIANTCPLGSVLTLRGYIPSVGCPVFRQIAGSLWLDRDKTRVPRSQ